MPVVKYRKLNSKYFYRNQPHLLHEKEFFSLLKNGKKNIQDVRTESTVRDERD